MLDTGSDRTADRSTTGDDRSSSHRRTRKSDVLVGVETDIEDNTATVEQYVPAQAEVVNENADLSYVTVRFPEQAADAVRENFRAAVTKKDGIRYAEPNTTLDLGYTPSDPQFSDQTAAKMVNADAAWDLTTGSSDVTIAILDQGVMYDHPDLDANMDGSVTNYGKDFVSDDSDPYPVDKTNEFHGTHVAGIAAAEIDNSEGVAGISQSSVLSGRVADETHSATAADVADGVSWATNEGADIINLSLSGDANSVLKDAVEYAYRNGVLIVAAAGNTARGAVQYPAAYDECIAVSALTPDGNLASFSSVGSEIELTAPGMAVVSTTTTDGYGMYSGTSMAAPIVSGVAALAKSKFSLSNDELRAHLKDAAVDVGLSAQEQGYGRIDARQAVSKTSDVTVVDDFEDGDLSEYSFDRGSSGASIVSSPTYSGSSSLEMAGDYTEMISTSGLSTYPSAGDTFSCWMRLDAGVENANFTYGVQDHGNRYYVKLDGEQDGWWLFKYENGSGASISGESGIGLSADTWYEVEVEWRTDGDHILTLMDASGSVLSQVVATESTWTDGGIGFDAYLSSDEAVYFDAVTKDTSGGDGEELSLVDDFEDGDLSEYTNASSTNWSAQNSFAFDGSYSAGNTSNSEVIYNNSHTYSRGDEFELRTYLGTANSVSTGLEHWFCTNADATKKYVHYVSAEENEQYLTYRNGIDQTIIDSADVDVPSDEWLRIKVSSDDKTLTAEVYDAAGTLLSSVSGTDENLSSGGYGFKDEWRKEGPAVYVDTIRG